MADFNWVDYIILGIFFISIIAGMGRGFVKEMIALATWVAAFIIASLFATRVAAYFSDSSAGQAVISSVSSMGSQATQSLSVISIALSFIGLFVLVLIIGSIVNYFVSAAVSLSIVNRLLGGVFGFFRGFLINLVLIFLIQLSPFQQESWWTQSRFVISFQPAVKYLGDLVQPGLATLKSKVGDTLNDMNNKYVPSAKSLIQDFTNPAKK